MKLAFYAFPTSAAIGLGYALSSYNDSQRLLMLAIALAVANVVLLLASELVEDTDGTV